MRLEVTILGSSSGASTRDRGQGGYVLRWLDELVLFDPGEGAQRQLLLAGLSPSQITRICITHFHGDHCLGLPGVLQAREASVARPVTLHYAPDGQRFVDHLLACSVAEDPLPVRLEPVGAGSEIVTPQFILQCEALHHTTPSVGYRLVGEPRRHLVPERLAELGITGERVGLLQQTGEIEHGGQVVRFEEVSEPAMAFVMDTAPCPGAAVLMADADLVVCESTYLSGEAALASDRRHMTAEQAATLAADARVGLLVLSHFSSRYHDVEAFAAEASRGFTPVVAARDLSSIAWQTDRHAAGSGLRVGV